jgi:hypothetical protein
MKLGAEFNADRRYRYRLWRIWREELPIINWLMLNPSTADETRDDPTIKKCIAWSINWGYGGLNILNIFAFRSTHPINLVGLKNAAVGEANDATIRKTLEIDAPIVCAWGKVFKGLEFRREQIWRLLRPFQDRLLCLRTNQDGSPQHPLYIPFSAVPFKWEGYEKHAIPKAAAASDPATAVL